MAKRHTKDQRKAWAKEAERTSDEQVAARAGVQASTVAKWRKEFLPSQPRQSDQAAGAKAVSPKIRVNRERYLHLLPVDVTSMDADSLKLFKIHYAENETLDEDTMWALVMDRTPIVRVSIARNPSITDDMLNVLLDDSDFAVRYEIAFRPDLQPHHLDQIMQSDDEYSIVAAAAHPNATPEQFDACWKRDLSAPHRAFLLRSSPHITEAHIEEAMSSEVYGLQVAAFQSPNVSDNQLRRGLTNPDARIRYTAAGNDSLSGDMLSAALASDSPHDVRMASLNPNITTDQMYDLFEHQADVVRAGIARHKKVPADILNEALNDPSSKVRAAAAGNPLCTDQQRGRALMDDDIEVARNAASNVNASADLLDFGLRHPHPLVRNDTAENPNLASHHLDIILWENIEEGYLRVIGHPDATREQLVECSKRLRGHLD